MRKKVKVPFPSFRGLIAAPASAHGAEFFILEVEEPAGFSIEGDAAIVDVCGPLVQHASFMMPSYDVIRKNVLAALESDAKRVVLRIDSPGGDFAGSLELGRSLREMAKAAGKPLLAFTDSMALSAAYALACAAEEIVITPSAYLGSVGVWAALCDETARDAAQGINIAVVASGSSKADRNPHVRITENAIARLQTEVDDMATLFFGVVADLRGIPLSRLVALQGAQEFGEKALSLGLADRVVNSWEDFMSPTSMGNGVNAMASKFSMKEARAAYRATLAKGAADDSDDGKEAAAALAEFDKDEAKKAKAADEEKEKAKGEGPGDGDGDSDDKNKETAKAAGEEDKKEAKAEGEDKKDMKAAASAEPNPLALALQTAKDFQEFKAQVAKDNDARERSTLLASRPDFTPVQKATLALAPLAIVKDACSNWPRIASPNEAAASANIPGGTRGDTQGRETNAGAEFIGRESAEDFIARKMGQAPAKGGVVNTGKSLVLGFMSPKDVERAIAAQKGGE